MFISILVLEGRYTSKAQTPDMYQTSMSVKLVIPLKSSTQGWHCLNSLLVMMDFWHSRSSDERRLDQYLNTALTQLLKALTVWWSYLWCLRN